MKINEVIDIYDDEDFDKAAEYGETEVILKSTEHFPVKLRTWHNWDNAYDELLYFYKHDKNKNVYYAVSISRITFDSPSFIAKLRKFEDNVEHLLSIEDDPWEIYPHDLEESDIESLRQIFKDIFESKYSPEIRDNALSYIK